MLFYGGDHKMGEKENVTNMVSIAASIQYAYTLWLWSFPRDCVKPGLRKIRVKCVGGGGGGEGGDTSAWMPDQSKFAVLEQLKLLAFDKNMHF